MNSIYKLAGSCMMIFLCAAAQAQVILTEGTWQAALQREDGIRIPFELDIRREAGQYACYIVNGAERVKTEGIVPLKDSAVIRMPVFESYFKVKIISKDSLNGTWISGDAGMDVSIPFTAAAGGMRFPVTRTENAGQVQGKWSMAFTRADQSIRRAIGEFTQTGNKLSGTVLTPAADYRYLIGVVSGDSLFLSTFDGAHALLLAAKIHADSMTGNFYSGAGHKERWRALRGEHVTLAPAVTAVREGSNGRPDFSFPDLDGHTVSLQSERFKGKVVILQVMGSWCPNCMDETAFLSEYYRKNKDRGVEVIALAYELSTDTTRSKKSLEKFRTQFKVQYPILNTGVTASDPKRTEKTLPQLTALKVFPTTIILDKKGVVRDVHTTFYGPGAADHHLKFKADFERSVDALLRER